MEWPTSTMFGPSPSSFSHGCLSLSRCARSLSMKEHTCSHCSGRPEEDPKDMELIRAKRTLKAKKAPCHTHPRTRGRGLQERERARDRCAGGRQVERTKRLRDRR
eukprot:scaffold23537_cov22-Tisochrysis_lutea.AAC.2